MVSCATEAAHQRRDLRADRKLATGTGFYDTDAFDATDFGSFRPFATPHVDFGMIDAKRLNCDNDETLFRFRLRDVLVNKPIDASELLNDNCAHLSLLKS